MSKTVRLSNGCTADGRGETRMLSPSKSMGNLLKSNLERLQQKNASMAPKYKEICTKTIKCGIEMKTSLDIFGRTDARPFSVVLADITHLRAI